MKEGSSVFWCKSRSALYVILPILVSLFLIGCANQNAWEYSKATTDNEHVTEETSPKATTDNEHVTEETSPKATTVIEYGIGTAILNDTIGKEWKANQDVPTYSNGKVSAKVDESEKITKILVYFNEADMSDDYVLYFAGKAYPSIESITSQFGDFNSDSIIEYSDGKATFHLEITNKSKNEYYMSLW